MSVHPIGDGAAWVEDVDVDQPHGLDYRYENHSNKAIRLRMEKGHADFGDSTAGGEHRPGGAGVLGMEITDAGGDITAVVDADATAGTFKGRGIAWAYDGSQTAVLLCNTDAAESTTASSWREVLMHPDRQWDGGDVTWTGAHEFDSSVDFTGVVNIAGDLRFDNGTSLVNIADNSLVFDNTTADIGVRFDCSVSCASAVEFDGTVEFAGNVDVTAVVWVYKTGSSVYTDGVLTIRAGRLDTTAGGVISVCGDVSASDATSCTWQIFGAEVSTDGDGADIAVATRYHTNTDGFVIVSDWSRATTLPLTLQADYSLDLDPASTVISDRDGETNYSAGFSYPISACQYFCLSTNAAATQPEKYLWKPIGGGDLSAQ